MIEQTHSDIRRLESQINQIRDTNASKIQKIADNNQNMAHDLELYKENQDRIWESHRREMNEFKERIDIVWDRSNSNERLSKQNR